MMARTEANIQGSKWGMKQKLSTYECMGFLHHHCDFQPSKATCLHSHTKLCTHAEIYLCPPTCKRRCFHERTKAGGHMQTHRNTPRRPHTHIPQMGAGERTSEHTRTHLHIHTCTHTERERDVKIGSCR